MVEQRYVACHEQHVEKRKSIEDILPAVWRTNGKQHEGYSNADSYHQGFVKGSTLGEEADVEQCNERIGEEEGLRYADGYYYHTVEQVAHKRLLRKRLADECCTVDKERDPHHLACKCIILELFLIGYGK